MIDLRLGDCIELMRGLDAESVHCIVTSPPYWGLRAYGTEPRIWPNGAELCTEHEWGDAAAHPGSNYRRDKGVVCSGGASTFSEIAKVNNSSGGNTCSRCGAWRGELGSEPTPELYVAHIVSVFHEARRVLRSDGTLWINLGDSYNGSGGYGGDNTPTALAGSKQTTNKGSHKKIESRAPGLKPKDLVGIPWMVAFALRADGWYLRSDIIWSKPNPMPESVTDRPTKAHEYLFLLSKSERYYYDARRNNGPTPKASRSRGR